jgi:hypothetical protein
MPINDPFGGAALASGPAYHWFAVTPADVDLPVMPRWVYVATAGSLAITGRDGVNVTLANIPAGTLLPIRPVRITAAPANTIALY